MILRLYYLLLICVSLNFSMLISSNTELKTKEELLIAHVIESIDKASKGISKLNWVVLQVPGFQVLKCDTCLITYVHIHIQII